ncbi:hypothetical protein ETU10_08470 [Apibacter muscae]|uniref:hypothetical protein n=1 Tax=Apibacter muscae TaxID=2509004 RepID=UPI0011AD1658|nr:hypothetical protein [Apibacter muscae]TWP23120.1 hypothetical protein ETU10_08470 [Apibacter muscae]
MKKLNHLFSLLFALSLLFISCQSDSFSDISETPDLKVMNFTYNGKQYSSTYTIKNDSTYVINDNEVQSLYNEIINNPTLSILVNEDGSIEYYENYEKIKEKASLKPFSNFNVVKSGYVIMYEHDNYFGRSIGYNIPVIAKGVPRELNDKITSIYAQGTYNFSVTIFEHGGLGGRSLTLKPVRVNNQYILEVFNLKSYKYGGGFFNLRKWNDRLSSFRVD